MIDRVKLKTDKLKYRQARLGLTFYLKIFLCMFVKLKENAVTYIPGYITISARPVECDSRQLEYSGHKIQPSQTSHR